jgi:hypothetical protein
MLALMRWMSDVSMAAMVAALIIPSHQAVAVTVAGCDGRDVVMKHRIRD